MNASRAVMVEAISMPVPPLVDGMNLRGKEARKWTGRPPARPVSLFAWRVLLPGLSSAPASEDGGRSDGRGGAAGFCSETGG